MGRSVRADIQQADREMGRFIHAQFEHARRLGFPRMTTFARDIARGDVGMPPPTQDDPLMDCVGEFYFQNIREIERRMLADKYSGNGSEYERARRIGQTKGRYRVGIDRLLERCSGFIRARGF